MSEAKHTPGIWDYVPSTEHHGPYVVSATYGGDICDCYTMSNLASASVRNGGDSYPISFQGDNADANARLIAAAPDLLAAAERVLAHLWARIDDAPSNSKPVFDGIADLHDAINKATGKSP